MRPLRFCMVTTFYPPFNFGGDGIGIRRFCRALVRLGHRVTVVQDIDGFELLSDGPPAATPEDDGVEVVRLRSGAGPLAVLLTHQTGRSPLNGGKIRRLLESGRFDVINFHNISLAGGPAVLAAGEAVKLYMAHEHWLVCPTHVLWRHRREPCTGRECLRCGLAYRRPPQLWRHTGLLERRLRHVDAFIAMSEFSRAKHREFGFPRDMEVVNYFLPPAAPPEGEAPPVHERPFFLFVGRLESIKGLDTVLPIFAGFGDADLLVLGDGEERERLERMAAGSSSIRFLGRVAPERLADYYRQAIALIVPSVGFETFGIVLIEAFRQGTPVLARRIGPFPEIVERCRGGLLFGDEAELTAGMRRLQREPQTRAEMAQRAVEGFRRHFTEEAVMPRYLDVVRRAAERRGRPDVAARARPAPR